MSEVTNDTEERRLNVEIAHGYISDVKSWLLELLAGGKITREVYEMQCNRLVLAQCSLDALLEREEGQ